MVLLSQLSSCLAYSRQCWSTRHGADISSRLKVTARSQYETHQSLNGQHLGWRNGQRRVSSNQRKVCLFARRLHVRHHIVQYKRNKEGRKGMVRCFCDRHRPAIIGVLLCCVIYALFQRMPYRHILCHNKLNLSIIAIVRDKLTGRPEAADGETDLKKAPNSI